MRKSAQISKSQSAKRLVSTKANLLKNEFFAPMSGGDAPINALTASQHVSESLF